MEQVPDQGISGRKCITVNGFQVKVCCTRTTFRQSWKKEIKGLADIMHSSSSSKDGKVTRFGDIFAPFGELQGTMAKFLNKNYQNERNGQKHFAFVIIKFGF